ncbi:oxidoreductase [Asanoa sp. WMMD1127]|uniref:oxidoreductase n=1 Tax=Asanoa sp. WMMD1127 TaxID=3016107 RepID=UPI0024178B64|nr:oxidoreductase [Asanoa sp. WMMD1127]MDG4826290.1 oxidoreductase [Asanoa sp. WMMD1127]
MDVWLITGAGNGLGRAMAEAAAEAGNVVVATSRRVDGLTYAYPDRIEALPLDVTDPTAVAAVVADVEARYGRIDVLVNNAGRGQVGAAEETTDADLRDLFEVHVFGPAALVRAVLPGMRARRSGTIVQMSSYGGVVGNAGFSAYCATKFALEGYSESLAAEVAPLGIRVLIVEPGNFRTGLLGPRMHETKPTSAYAETVGATRAFLTASHGAQSGDPARAAAAILRALAADEPPLRLPLGGDAVDGILAHLAAATEEVRAWSEVSRDTSFTDAGPARSLPRPGR